LKEENFERSLKSFRDRRPFRPFLVELASGAQVIVEHPEALAHRGTLAVYINPSGEWTLFDNTMVTRVTEITGNGSKRGRKPA
jgi:hypothetical protein